jgi:hypothetical protein
MYEIFGELDSMEEINATAEGLKNEGDHKNLYQLAAENGIDAGFVDMYLNGTVEKLCCDVATAALGRIDVEAAEIKPVEIIEDWVEYIRTLCSDEEGFARAVRSRGKSLKGCIGSLFRWSFQKKYRVDQDIIEAAGIGKVRVEMGIPGNGTAKKLIKQYYLDKGGADR